MVTDKILSRKEILTALYNSNYEFMIRAELSIKLLESEIVKNEAEYKEQERLYAEWKKKKAEKTLKKGERCPIGKHELDLMRDTLNKQKQLIIKSNDEIDRKTEALRVIQEQIDNENKVN